MTTAYSNPSSSYPAAFRRAVACVLTDEGGYVDNPADAGGETKFGICKRNYPELDIKSLTMEDAIAIYYRDWWMRFNFAALPGPASVKLFDLAVNIGPVHAVRCLQQALRACGKPVLEDGVLGNKTSAAATAANQLALMAALRSEAAGYYRLLAADDRRGSVANNREFLNGWLNRAYR